MLRFCDLVLRAASPLVPYDVRRDWLREWRAEFSYAASRAERADRGLRVAVVVRVFGAVVHAAWLRWDRWRLDMFLQDIRHSLRSLTRTPGFSAVVVLTLALGIGTTTAIFAVTDHLLLRPVRYPEPSRLAVIWETSPTIQLPVMFASPPNLYEWQRRSKTFASMGGFQWRDVTLGGAEPERIRSARVTAGLLPALGVEPRIGRWFLPEEDRAGARPVVILSDTLWSRRFQRAPGIIGRTIPIDGVPTEVIGVMPGSFVGPPALALRGAPSTEQAELWVPHGTDLEAGQRAAHYLSVIGRLAPGSTIESADREMHDIQAQIEREFPDYQAWRSRVVPLVDQVTASSRRAVTLLVAAVAFLLLLACANVANLLLARGVGRGREFAIRTALGAGRARVALQVGSEVLVLALAGGIVGLVMAGALLRVMMLLGPASLPGLRTVGMNWRTGVFAVAASIAAAMLAGAIPALGVMRARLVNWLADRSGGAGAGAVRAQQALAVGQIGLAVSLLVTASLLVESFRQIRAVDPGFQPAQVTTAKLTMPPSRYPDNPAKVRFVDRLMAELRQAPGIQAAGLIDAVPLADSRQGTGFVRLDGPPADVTASQNTNVAWISEGYFEALGVPLIAGRTFTAEDTDKRDRVIVINRALAGQVFGKDDPLGRLVRVGVSSRAPFQVVGVVGDEKHLGLATDAPPAMFLSYRQVPAVRDLSIIVRSSGGAQGIPASLRAIVGRLDPDTAVFQVRTMEQVMDASVAAPRAIAWLVSSFALSALMLAAIGVFGVMSHAVRQRTREIGIRMAIGASPQRMLGAVLGEGLAQVGLGVVVGGVLSILSARLLSGLLFGVSGLTVGPYLFVGVLLGMVAVVACLLPARRAMRIDPSTALRAD